MVRGRLAQLMRRRPIGVAAGGLGNNEHVATVEAIERIAAAPACSCIVERAIMIGGSYCPTVSVPGIIFDRSFQHEDLSSIKRPLDGAADRLAVTASNRVLAIDRVTITIAIFLLIPNCRRRDQRQRASTFDLARARRTDARIARERPARYADAWVCGRSTSTSYTSGRGFGLPLRWSA